MSPEILGLRNGIPLALESFGSDDDDDKGG
jgi:hypothetical protein